ncbi:MAG TPA: amino acid adenylation domain-containing protein, partial [Anaerolineae bacterium]|nr:amino acid adenylation domain-containing protein [Anaerolineae bacterium]
QALLFRYTGQSDIVVGSPIANRICTEIEGLIGFFVNTLVLRADLSGNPTFRELIQRVREMTLEAFAHPELPFEILVEKLQPERDLSRSPFFQVMFVLNVPIEIAKTPDLTLNLLDVENGRAQFDVTLFVTETERRLLGSLEYNVALFDAATMTRLAGHYQQLLEDIVANPDRRISDLTLLTEGEWRRVVEEWNASGAAFPLGQCFEELLEAQVARAPDAIAAVEDAVHLSYQHLNQRANGLAVQLGAQGVAADSVVGLLAERGLDFLTAMLAVFKAGGAYLPLDPRYPATRLRQVVSQSRSRLVLCACGLLPGLEEALAGLAEAERPTVLDLEAVLTQAGLSPNLPVRHQPGHLAYVIYTSGSTGLPKGAMVEQRGMVNHLFAKIRDLALNERDIVAQTAPQSFDISVWQFLAGLLVGGAVHILRDEVAFDPTQLLAQVAQRHVTVLETVPSLLRAMLEAMAGGALYDLRSLRWLMPTGEALPPDLARQWLSYYPGTPVINAYGPTECSDDVTHYPFTTPPGAEVVRIPIGRPVANLRLYVLDGQGQPVPVGVAGELYVGGVGVGRGYLHDPLKTAQAFVPDPFAVQPGARLYRTGDLAYWRSDGQLEFLGRVDHQVKVRGFRIELGEIEAVVRQQPAVREAVVVVREDRPGDQRLVAYVVAQEGQVVASGEVRHWVQERLPEYMVPAAVVELTALPLTPNGKLDRRALPAPDATRPELETAYISPRSEAERIIAEIWKELLHVEQVGVNDNFFDLGGHSLLVMQIHSRLVAAFGKEFPMTELFRHTTVASLAQYFGDTQELIDTPPVEAVQSRVTRRRQLAEGHDIAIIGMAGRFPGADDLDQFWNNLCQGVENVKFFSDEELLASGIDPDLLSNPNYVKASATLSDIDRFDARFFGINPREAEVMDPQERLFLEYVWHALEHAGYDPQRYNGRIGVYAGQTFSSYLLNNLYSNQGRIDAPSIFQALVSNNTDYLATQAAYRLNLKGPAFSVQTACSTSLVAVHVACQALINGECDMALAGGISLRVPHTAGYLYEQGSILSPDGHCRPFDAGAQGTVIGSGVGVVVLKSLAAALEDGDIIHAVIKGSAINNDGARKIGFTAPSEDGQVEVISEALAMAGFTPDMISYVEAHGTGTVLGDPIEVAALTRVFRAGTPAQRFCGLGSVKSNVGHLDAAAGVAGLIKAVLALKHKQLPPSINFTTPNPKITWTDSPFYVNAELRDWESADGQPRRAGVSSFGIGGTNAHVVLEEAPPLPVVDQEHGERLLVLSAGTEEALEIATVQLAAHLRQHPAMNLADVAYTLQVGRHPFAHRRILVGADVADALATLEMNDPQRIFTTFEQSRHRPLVFMFPGQGAQYVNMGRGLYESERRFREVVDHCASLLEPHLGFSLLDALYPAPDGEVAATERLNQTAVTQPALFVIEYALARLWQAWGLQQQAMIGHSIGEYVAACLAGVFSLEDALALVAKRGQLIQQLPTGSMLSVPLAEAELSPYLNDQLALAAINGPRLCVVSGADEAITVLRTRLEAEEIDCRLLHTSHAFHSAMMEPVLDEFVTWVKRVTLNTPRIPFVSNLTGTWITANEATDPHYWARHLRQTVRFADGLQALLSSQAPVLLEVGPGRTLSTFAKQQNATTAFTSLRHPQDKLADRSFLLTTLGRLWLSGLDIDWQSFYADERRRRVPLPLYPFARERYWIDPQPEGMPAVRSLRKQSAVADWLYTPYWKPDTVPVSTGKLATWIVFGDEPELVTRLRAEGHRVYQVQAAEQFAISDLGTLTVAPHAARDYDRFFTEIDPAPQHFVYCLSTAFDFYGLLFLVQALSRRSLSRAQLTILTRNAQPVFANETVDPAQAMIYGVALVISQEYPDLVCRCIDLATPTQAWQVAALYDNLLADLTSDSTDPVIAYRGDRRWVQAFQSLTPTVGAAARLREGGVYLITGGLGRIGRTLARHLAETVRAKLVLTNRSALPPRAEWAQRLATQAATDPINERIRFVRDLETQGAEVLVLAADVADRVQLQAVLAQTHQRFGALHGVLHAAGIVDDKTVMPIQEVTPSVCETLFHPKIQGALTLAELLSDQELDFCLLFSSLVAVLGGLGSAVDAAANRFMDALAQQVNQRQPTPWLSVNWDRWQFAEDDQPNTGFGMSVAGLTLAPREGTQVF